MSARPARGTAIGLKFRDHVDPRDGASTVDAVLGRFGLTAADRRWRSPFADQAAAIESLAGLARRREADRGRHDAAPRFANFTTLDLDPGGRPGGRPAAGVIARALAALGGVVESATVAARVVPAGVVSDWDEPRSGAQRYLNAAPWGIGVRDEWGASPGRRVWDRRGGDGAGQRIVVVERGWTLDHPDLPASIHAVDGAEPSADPAARDHGTAMLGIVCAADNGRGIIGVAPNTASVNVVSCEPGVREPGESPTEAVQRAILRAIRYLTERPHYEGDVILLPLQWDTVTVGERVWRTLPIEVDDACFAAIRLATSLGIVVVEAAGNRGEDLDQFRDGGGRPVLRRDGANPDFRDSGAVMVGGAAASTASDGPAFHPSTNRGSRVDCFAHGRGVETCRLGGGHGAASGSSAASAIVAGAALAIQGIHWGRRRDPRARLGPRDLRRVLTERGTASVNAARDRIGVMPDLAGFRPSSRRGTARPTSVS